MNIINLTPHSISVFAADGKTLLVTFPPSGEIARVSVSRILADTQSGIPVFRSTYGAVTGLPAPAPGTAYVVSALVRQAVPTRRDVFSPGELIRDEKGQPVGCKGLEGNA